MWKIKQWEVNGSLSPSNNNNIKLLAPLTMFCLVQKLALTERLHFVWHKFITKKICWLLTRGKESRINAFFAHAFTRPERFWVCSWAQYLTLEAKIRICTSHRCALALGFLLGPREAIDYGFCSCKGLTGESRKVLPMSPLTNISHWQPIYVKTAARLWWYLDRC